MEKKCRPANEQIAPLGACKKLSIAANLAIAADRAKNSAALSRVRAALYIPASAAIRALYQR
jgi:ABC-type uncharacterized transport system ATPase component